MRRWLVLACVLALLAGTAKAADEPDPVKDAALRYYEAMGYDAIMQEALNLMATQVPEEYREDFKVHFGAYVIDEYKPAMADFLVQHFTAEELQAMAEFYESAVGRSIAGKMVPFTLDNMQFNEQQVMRILLSFVEAHPELMEE